MTTYENSMSAILKYAIVSHIKMNLVAKAVRGKDVEKALEMLEFMPKKSAKILYKVIKSAASNAQSQKWHDFWSLKVQAIEVWRWPKLKRIRFTSRARVRWYQKYRSFVKVVLEKK